MPGKRKPRWTPDEHARFLELRAQGLENAEIARLLGRTVKAVACRAVIYGLPYQYRPNEFRFWRKVDKRGGDECWLWLGWRDKDGYGRFVLRSSTGRVRAHRFAYEDVKGAIPPGLLVMHSCDNPPCCNPAHLSVGTTEDNIRDKLAKGRQSRYYGPGRT